MLETVDIDIAVELDDSAFLVMYEARWVHYWQTDVLFHVLLSSIEGCLSDLEAHLSSRVIYEATKGSLAIVGGTHSRLLGGITI